MSLRQHVINFTKEIWFNMGDQSIVFLWRIHFFYQGIQILLASKTFSSLFPCQAWLSINCLVLSGQLWVTLCCSSHCCSNAVIINWSWILRIIIYDLWGKLLLNFAQVSPKRPLARHERTSRTMPHLGEVRGGPFHGLLWLPLLREAIEKQHVWSLLSKLNHCYQVGFGQKLQKAHPRLTLQVVTNTR